MRSLPMVLNRSGSSAGSVRGIRVGALVPLSPPGWVEAGRQLLAGLERAVSEVNAAGGIAGRPLELVVRDTAATPQRAAAAVEELAGLGVTCLVGEYHSVAARAAAEVADDLRLPFLCSSAVLDTLTDRPTGWIARLAPPQSQGWRVFADYLLSVGHRHVAVAAQAGDYWASGTRILRQKLAAHGGTVMEMDADLLSPAAICSELAEGAVTALLLLVGHPEPAHSIVRSVRQDRRLSDLRIGAPAGQPEFRDWLRSLGPEGAEIPFLRYLPRRLGPLGTRVEAAIRQRLGHAPSFVALEGYDAILVVSDLLRSIEAGHEPAPDSWSRVTAEGTRGSIRFSRQPGMCVWQWTSAAIQVVEREPSRPEQIRILHAG